MDPVTNPYNPGVGTRPPALVGRDAEIATMDVTLQRLLRGTNGRSQLLTGLRGVGKTVLFNEFEDLAVGRGYFHEHIEVSEDSSLAPLLASALRRVLLAMDVKKRIGEAVQCLHVHVVELVDGQENPGRDESEPLRRPRRTSRPGRSTDHPAGPNTASNVDTQLGSVRDADRECLSVEL